MKNAGFSIFVAAGAALILGCATICSAQTKDGDILEKKTGELIGKVTYFSPRVDPTVMGVSDDNSLYDVSFLVNEKTRVDHKPALTDIGIGDTVKVAYDEIVRVSKGTKVSDWIAKTVVFVKAAEKKAEPSKSTTAESSYQGEGVYKSEEEIRE